MSNHQQMKELERRATASFLKTSRKFLLLLTVIAACLGAIHLSPVKEYLDIQYFKELIRGYGAAGPFVFLVLAVALTAVGCPRLIFSVVAGMLFGFSRGLFISLAGTIAGSYLTFIFARWSGRTWVLNHLPKHKMLDMALNTHSILAVALVRQMPLASILINFMISITRVSHSTFLAGTLLGYLPSSTIATLSGSSLGKQASVTSFIQLGTAILLLFALSGGIALIRKKMNHRDAA